MTLKNERLLNNSREFLLTSKKQEIPTLYTQTNSGGFNRLKDILRGYDFSQLISKVH